MVGGGGVKWISTVPYVPKRLHSVTDFNYLRVNFFLITSGSHETIVVHDAKGKWAIKDDHHTFLVVGR